MPKLLPYLLPSTRGVSRIANAPEKKATPQKKLKSKTKDEANARSETKVKDKKPSVEDKPLNLAFIGGALFMHLVKKQKAVEIYLISMRDIKYQLNKGTKPLTNLKTVVPAKYHDFLDVFSKDVSDTLRPYGKYDHKIKLFKDKNLSNLRHSVL